ncbi:MAG: ribosomal-processing cysteine protease Prp [Faecalibacterium sp.]|nr:ribosomal-processing cysteine protease Prp [Faecalibacterium sp.]
MTTVQIKTAPVQLPGLPQESQSLRLIVAGHACYGEKGKDIVCAAESILVQSLAAALAGLDEQQLFDLAVDGVAGSGCVAITALPTPAGFERVRGMFETACTGFCLLAKAYPAHVRVLRVWLAAEQNHHEGEEQHSA